MTTERDNDLVKVAYAQDESEAELLQGLLRSADVGSVVRRAPGFDVPEFGTAGPRHVLVAASNVAVARDVLAQVDSTEPEPEPTSRSSANWGLRLRVAVLLLAAVVVLVVCLATDVIV